MAQSSNDFISSMSPPGGNAPAGLAGARDGLSLLEGLAALFRSDPKTTNPIVSQAIADLPSRTPADKFNLVYRVLAEQLPAVVFLAFLDEGMGQAYVSPHIETVLGFTQAEWLEDPVRWYKQLHPEDKQRWSIDAAQMLLSGQSVKSIYRVIARNGQVVWLQCDARMLRHENGEPWLIHGVAFDITELKRSQEALEKSRDELETHVQERTTELAKTIDALEAEIAERKRAEAELDELNCTLEARVAERTEQLNQINAQLIQDIAKRKSLEQQLLHAQKMESIGTLAGGIAHDFNNILNIIQGYSSMLVEPSTHKAAAVAESAMVIQDAVRRGSNLVQQLLTIGRKTEPNLVVADIARIVEGLIGLLKQTIPKTIELSTDISAELPPVKADTNQLGQVLLNLCINARDAMPQGGKLTIRGYVYVNRLVDEERAHSVCIEVSDTGIGMSEEVRRRVFEPFFTTKNAEHGTGLGLSVAYAILANHGGSIDVESRPMQGTTFRMYLPVDSAEPEKARSEASSVPRSLGPGAHHGTVLLVEDEELMLSLLTEVLSRKGYHVFAAGDGERALELFHEHKDDIDVVLLDIGLPRVSGWEVFLEMQQAKPDIKAVIASGYLEPDLRNSMQNAGISHVIQKPYVPDDVLNALESLINKS